MKPNEKPIRKAAQKNHAAAQPRPFSKNVLPLSYLIIFVLTFLAGYLGWIWFLNRGEIPFDFHDWAEVNAPRLAFIQDAVRSGQFPLHMPDASALRGVTDRYFALPDVLWTPQLILLKWLSVGEFVLVHFLILYAIGFVGLVRLARRFKLSPDLFIVLFLIFTFNGHMLAHISVGHVTWGGTFLFPWFILWVYELYDLERVPWSWSLKVAALLFAVFLQGSFHQFVWALIFLILAVPTLWASRRPDLGKIRAVFFAGLFSVALSLFRILPVTLGLGGFDDDFLGGYRSISQLVRAFLRHVPPSDSLNRAVTGGTLGWWEYDLYLGFGILFILILFAIFRLKDYVRAHRAPAIWFPIAIMALFAIADVYAAFRALPIPLFRGERVSSRFLILPILFAAVEFLRSERTLRAALNARKWSRNALAIAAILFLPIAGYELITELDAWRVTNAVRAFPVTPTDLSIKTVANHADPAYIRALTLGAALTLITALIMAAIFLIERKSIHERNNK